MLPAPTVDIDHFLARTDPFFRGGGSIKNLMYHHFPVDVQNGKAGIRRDGIVSVHWSIDRPQRGGTGLAVRRGKLDMAVADFRDHAVDVFRDFAVVGAAEHGVAMFIVNALAELLVEIRIVMRPGNGVPDLIQHLLGPGGGRAVFRSGGDPHQQGGQCCKNFTAVSFHGCCHHHLLLRG